MASANIPLVTQKMKSLAILFTRRLPSSAPVHTLLRVPFVLLLSPPAIVALLAAAVPVLLLLLRSNSETLGTPPGLAANIHGVGALWKILYTMAVEKSMPHTTTNNAKHCRWGVVERQGVGRLWYVSLAKGRKRCDGLVGVP